MMLNVLSCAVWYEFQRLSHGSPDKAILANPKARNPSSSLDRRGGCLRLRLGHPEVCPLASNLEPLSLAGFLGEKSVCCPFSEKPGF